MAVNLLARVGDRIQARLESLGLFNRVSRTVGNQALNNPPSVIFRLLSDAPEGKLMEQRAAERRVLTYEILVIGSALDVGQGQEKLDSCIDAVRETFQLWKALPAGCLPSCLGRLELVDEIKNMLVYAAPLEITIFPQALDQKP